MTKEQAKHLSEVLKAYSEDKIIEVRAHMKDNDVWTPWIKFDDTVKNIALDNSAEYRIKPEPKLRPYKNAEEFLQAQKEHGMYLKFREYYHLPLEVSDNGVVIKYVEYRYNLLLQDYRFQDGTPCGIMVE